MDKKLFKRLKKSMQQHAKIARGELLPSRVKSRGPDDMSPELLASIARGLSDADAGRLVSVEDVMKEFGIDDRRSLARVSLRLSKSDRELLMRAASAQGKSVRRFVIAAALRAAAELNEQGHSGTPPPEPGRQGP